MTTTKITSAKDAQIEHIDFGSALSERYLAYALSTIMSRSLPDVRDGLKPVHRRLLYAMLQLRLDPTSAYKKCARVVGDVIGKYHPHGDVAVYDTLVRLAQSFSLRYPLIDGQGNFGSIDGDNAAAMRYTESRMTEICTLLMLDIDKDTVDFRATYDDSDTEPIIMPAMFPNLLANGSEGIAVGMATSIPPHNLHELCEALTYLVDHEKTEIKDVLQFVKGPDFPTGGIIIDNLQVIQQWYSTGRGSFRVRSRWKKQELSYGLYQIVITEIPYQVQKSKVIEQIAALFKDKKIPLISNIRDESTEDISLIIEPRDRNCDPNIIMESLFKLTSLENRIQLNMNVIDSNNIPKVANILEILQEFLLHRKNIITRRSRFLINKIEHRLEILNGLRIAYLNLDEIINIIREEDEPKHLMMVKFNLTELQVEAILNTKLRSLRKLEEQAIIEEQGVLEKEHATLLKILQAPKELNKILKKEIQLVQNKFGFSTKLGQRRTTFEEVKYEAQIIDISAFIAKEPITIICSKMGWIRSLKGHNNDLSSMKYKEGDEEKFVINAYTTNKILILSAAGRFFTILADNIFRGKGNGESIKLIVDIGNEEIVDVFVYKPNINLLLVNTQGKGFIVNSDEVVAATKLGKQVMRLPKNHACLKCEIVDGDYIACIGENRKLLIFKASEIPLIKRGQGVALQKFKDAKLVDIKIFNGETGLSWTSGDKISGNKIKIEKNILPFLGHRGGAGKIPPSGFPKNNKFS